MKKSGGNSGELFKDFVRFHRLRGGFCKEVPGAVYAAAGSMKEVCMPYAFLMLAYDGPSSSKGDAADFIKASEITAWVRALPSTLSTEVLQTRAAAEEWLVTLRKLTHSMPKSNLLTKLVARFHIDLVLICLGETKMSAYRKGLQNAVDNAKKHAQTVAKERSAVEGVPRPLVTDSASAFPAASAPACASASDAASAQTKSSGYVLACANSLAECEPPRTTLDEAGYHFLDKFKTLFPGVTDVAADWERFLESAGSKRPAKSGGNVVQKMEVNTIDMAEISPEGKVQDRANTCVRYVA